MVVEVPFRCGENNALIPWCLPKGSSFIYMGTQLI
jgi:hypothetical protein